MKAIIITAVSVCFLFFHALADSPLTSTPFWEAYKNEKIIIETKLAEGVLTNQLADFLISKKNKIDVKMAVINCLSWDFNGKKNAQIFVNRLLEKGNYKNTTDFKTNGSADHLLCMAYLKAMDNYFDVTEAFEWAEAALLKNNSSYTFSIIHSLIHAQILFDSDWCLVWLTAYSVQNDKSLKADLRPEAVRIIFDYMGLYREYCK